MTTVVSGSGLGLLNTSLYVLGSGVLGQAAQGRAGERVYVNAATGNLVVRNADEVLLGRGPDVNLLRTYNSQGLLNDDNGDNWRLGIYRKVYNLTGTVNTAGSTVRRVEADASEALYTYDAARGLYVNSDSGGAFDTLSFNATTQVWTFADGDTQVKELYDNANGGRLTRVQDPDGNSLTLTYNAAGLITQVADASGESTFLDYTGTNLTQIRTVMGAATLTRTRYAYDASNRLTQVTTDLSPADNSVADGKTYVVNYTYEGTSRRVATMTQSDGTSLTFTYVQVGADFRVATVRDALGQLTSFAYNTAARTTTVTDALGLVTTLAYDPAGQLLSITSPAVPGVSQVTRYAYDASGNVTSVTDAKNNVVTYQYDANGNRVLERDAAGNTVTRTFGAKNELLTETTYLVPDPDGAGAGQPGSPLTTRYVYSATNHLRFTVSAQGVVTEYRYNGFGQQVAAIQYQVNVYSLTGLTQTTALSESQLTTFVGTADKTKTIRLDSTYDFRGQLASTTSYTSVDTAGNGVLDGTQAVTQYVYDQAGNLLKKVDPRGVATTTIPNDFTTTYTYDGLNRQLSMVDALGRTTLALFDDPNRKVTVTLANGLSTISTYDAAGSLVSVVQSGNSVALGTTSYFYDADKRLRRTADPTGISTHILYDEAGRKIGSIDGRGTLTEYRYDANNNLTKAIQYAVAVSAANLASLSDALGKPTNVTLATIRPASNAADRITFNAYDSANRLVKSVDEAGFVTQFLYDGAGQLTDTVAYATAIATAGLTDAPTPASIAPVTSAADRVSRNFYNNDGKLRGRLDGEGFLVEYKYDSAGELNETIGYVTATNPALRATGTLAQLLPAANAADTHSGVLYDVKGQVAGTVDAEGFLTENVYDSAGNKTRVIRYATKVTFVAGAKVASLRPAASAQDQVVSSSYTALNQLATGTDVDGTINQYTYDEVGNLVSTVKAINTADVRTLLVQYDKQGRVTAELSSNGAAQLTGGQTQAQIDAIWAANAVKYTYDAAGRRTSSTDANGHRTLFFYNAKGNPTHTVNALGEVSESVYDALGQLVRSIQYGTRLSAATLASLSGGLVNSTLTSALAGIANPGADSKTDYAYTATGKLARKVDPLGNAVAQAFNAFGELTSSSQAIGGGLTLDHAYTYDHRGLLTQTVWDPSGANTSASTVYDAFGRAIRTTDARGGVTIQSYDKLGRVVSTTDPLNQTQSVTYDAFDRVLTRTDALGKVTSYSYNTANRSVTVTTPEGVVATTAKNRHGQTISLTDGRGSTTTYQYDKDGNLTSTTAPAAGTTTQLYDKADLLIETVDANATRTTFTYDAANRALTKTVDPGTGHLNLVTAYAYDAKGQTVSVTDAKGVLTQTGFDLKGEVTSVVVDPGGLNLTTTYTYDARGKKLSVIEGAGSANPKLTVYAYDKLGRLASERVDPNGVNATTTYVYDKNDNVALKVDALGNLTRYAYDAKDRLVYTVDPLGAVSRNDYDAEGRIVRHTEYATPISLTGLSGTPTAADIAARVAASAKDFSRSYVLDGDGREIFCIDAVGAVTQKFYDGNDNLVRKIEYANPIPVGTELTQAAVAAALRPDPANDGVTRTAYDAANRAVYDIDALNLVKETQYDNLGQITRTIQYAQPVLVSATPSAAEVAGALAPESEPINVANQTETFYRNPTQPYSYAANAQNDVAAPATQSVGMTTSTIVGSTPPAQPYTYVASAKQDVASPATQSITATLSRATVGDTIRTTLAWPASVTPPATSASFGYRVLGSGAAFTAATVVASGSNLQAAIDGLATGSYEYQIKYTDAYGRVLKSGGGSFAVNTSSADILYQYADGNLVVQLQDGTTSIGGGWLNFQMATTYGLTQVGVGDFNGDGVKDILFRDPGSGALAIQYVEGPTHLGGGWIDNVVGSDWFVAGIGDFNGDGKDDVAYRRGDGLVLIQFLNGQTGLGGGVIPNNGFDASWNVVGVGDFNGDGLDDLAFRQPGTGWTQVAFMNGVTIVGGGTIEANVFDSVWDFAGTGDFNGDGKDDLAFYSPVYNLFDVALLNGTASLGGGPIGFQPGGGWRAVQVTDFNGDGRADVLWRYADGRAFISYQNGLTTIGGDWLTNQLPPDFTVVGAGPLRTRTGLTRGSVNSALNFSYTQVTSTATAGSSISGYIPAAQVSSIDRVSASVTDIATGVVVSSNVLTYPEFEANYNGEVNLKLGSALANGRYNVAITVYYKNGTVEAKPVFVYEVGPQQLRLQESIVWPASVQPAGTAVSFMYRAAGTSNPWLTPPVGISGTNQSVALDLIPAGTYEYQIQYKDAYNRLLKSTASTFIVTSGASSTVTSTAFSYIQVTSSAAAGSSITGYISAAQVPTIDYVDATVKDLSGNIVSTARTYPEFEPAYNGRVNLKVGSALADGKYNVTVTIRRKDTTSSASTFYYEVGPQIDFQRRTTTLSWQVPDGVTGASAQFSYAPVGSPSFLNAPVTRSGVNDTVALTNLADGTWAYRVRYLLSDGTLVREASGTFTSTASSAVSASLQFASAGQSAQFESYVYDAAGRVAWSIDAAGFARSFDYDARGNVVRTVEYARPVAVTALTQAALAAAVVPDAADRVTRTVYDAASRAVYVIDALGYAKQVQYDAFGRVARTIEYSQPITASATPSIAELTAIFAPQSVSVSATNRTDPINVTSLGADLLLRGPDGTVQVQLLDGVKARGGGAISFQLPSDFPLLGTGDFDGDGRQDILYRAPGNYSTMGALVIQYADGTTHLGGGYVDNVFPLDWSVIGIGDFNGDGKDDVVYEHAGDGLVAIQFLNGMTGAGGGLVLNQSVFDATWKVVGVGDFNGDGKADLVYRQTGTGSTVIQYMDGITPAGGGHIAADVFDSVWTLVGTGDFNGDGNDDLLYYSATYALAEVALLGGLANLGGGTIGFEPGPGWKPTQVADFNADGRDDIAWRDPNGGVYLSYLNGLSSAGGGYISNNAWPANYALVGAGILKARPYFAGNERTTTLSWQVPVGVAGASVEFSYSGLDWPGYTLQAPVVRNGTSDGVSLLNLVDGTWKYRVRYFVGGTLVREATGTFGANAASAQSGQLQFISAATQDQRVTSYTYDADGRLTAKVDALGFVERYTYDALGDKLSYTDQNDNTKSYVYDARGREIQCIDALGGVTQKTYDAAGNLVRTARQDRATRTVYDADNRPVYEIDALGYVKETRYDGRGRIRQTILYMQPIAVSAVPSASEVAAALAPQSGAAGNEIDSFVYDAAGQLVASVDAEGFVERYGYDAQGNKVAFVNKLGNTWSYTYDALGRMTSETTPPVAVYSASENVGGVFITPSTAPLKTVLAYDAFGDVVARTEAAGRAEARTTRYQYDALGHQTGTTFPTVNVYNGIADPQTTNGIDGTVVRTEMAVNPQVVVRYDAFGNAVANYDAAGNWSYKAYDALKRLTYEIDAEGYVTAYGYDGAGNRTSVTRYGTALNFAGHVTGAAFTVAEVAARLTGGGDRTIITQYDPLNRATLVTQPVVYAYDSTAPAGTQPYFFASPTTRNTYNVFGELIVQASLKNPGADLVAGTGDDSWLSTYFYYDQRGAKVAQVDALGYLTRSLYDAAGNLTDETQYARALTPGSWNTTGYAAPAVTTPQSNPSSPIGYDRMLHYQYDRKNQKIAETRVDAEFGTVSGTLGLGTAAGDLTTRYGYDALGNVRTVVDPLGAVNAAYYDALGRLILTVEPARYDFQTTLVSPLTETRYDAFGNVVQTTRSAPGSPVADQTTLNAYDSLGHLIHTVDPEGAHRYNSYDVMGRLVKTWAPVVNVDGQQNNSIQWLYYDRLGRQTQTVDAPFLTFGAPLQDFTVHQTQYNAHGEITAKNLNYQWQEYYHYDAAGRLWRTNDGDGVDKVYFYDLQGKATSEIKSQAIDLLNSYSAPWQLQTANAGFERTYTFYDALGRATRQQLPWSAGGSIVPNVYQTLDRWGNALSVTDARGYTTDFRYNYLDKVVEVKQPWTDVWYENGADIVSRPTTRTYYDPLGRTIGTIDANGNPTSYFYDAGGNLYVEYHADGGAVVYGYDGLGRRLRTTDALNNVTWSFYDRDDRLVRVVRPIGEENYRYDQAGNRIQSTNAAGETMTYWYDTRGKLIRSQLPLGQRTSFYYDLDGNKATEISANGDVMTWTHDHFGRLLAHTDMAGATYSYAYDRAGRVVQQVLVRGDPNAPGVTTYQYYENGALQRVYDSSNAGQTIYSYDAAGNRVFEYYDRLGAVYQNETIVYDELGRVKSVSDIRLPSLNYRYDTAGNRRTVYGSYLDAFNQVQSFADWYAYDGMNRMTVSQGIYNGSGVQIGPSQGTAIAYDANGNRRVVSTWTSVDNNYYDGNDRLIQTWRLDTPDSSRLLSTQSYDAAGRVIEQISLAADPARSGTFDRHVNTYNANGWIVEQTVYSQFGAILQDTQYPGYDAMGNVTSYWTNVWAATGGPSPVFTNYYDLFYLKYDTYRQFLVNGRHTVWGNVQTTTGTTTTTYEMNGSVSSVVDQFGGKTPKSFISNGSGQILLEGQNGLLQTFFYANGLQIGTSGGLAGADFNRSPGGSSNAVRGVQDPTNPAGANFGVYTPISDQYPGLAPSSYIVSAGDTLRSIAFALFGDAQLWYVIADANGITNDSDLAVGQRLVIPNKVENVHNNYQTFRPYNELEIIGDTTPTLPNPPPPAAAHRKKGCGGIGQILVAIIAVVVTLVLAPILAPVLGPVLGAAAAAAVGSVVSQGVGIALGVQSKFNWGAVAVAALSAGITEGIGVSGWAPTGSAIVDQAIQGVARNVIQQGVAIAVGQQRSFSWAAIAGAAVTGAVTGALGGQTVPSLSGGSTAYNPVAGFVGNVAGGVVRAALQGGKINFAQIAADAFGNTLGTALGMSISQGIGQQTQRLTDVQSQPEENEEPEPIPMPRPRPDSLRAMAARSGVLLDDDGNVEVLGRNSPTWAEVDGKVAMDSPRAMAARHGVLLDADGNIAIMGRNAPTWQEMDARGAPNSLPELTSDDWDDAYRGQAMLERLARFYGSTGSERLQNPQPAGADEATLTPAFWPDGHTSIARRSFDAVYGPGNSSLFDQYNYGMRWPDFASENPFGVPNRENFSNEYEFSRKYFFPDKNSTMHRSFSGDLQFWHAMVPPGDWTNGQILEKIIDQHRTWWNLALEKNDLFYVGNVSHTVTDSYPLGHVIRDEGGNIVSFRRYGGENEGIPHSKYDNFDETVTAHQWALESNTEILRMFRDRIPFDGPGGVEDYLRNHVFKFAPGAADAPAGAPLPKVTPRHYLQNSYRPSRTL